ncbi:hypothetical protein AVDCRST_MAG92-2952 [uncultured Coleofasciculus sp.]|uniref:Uncharacterized protein n=1 Tax=uncultured Coleofasciculus sp. TaxID=1267456 RepID=A0A6J4J504_9CYAN|nr:hypothetical protein AVDCRST_MAG92-2952 [uncultured Coleofasciculus sp.]
MYSCELTNCYNFQETRVNKKPEQSNLEQPMAAMGQNSP